MSERIGLSKELRDRIASLPCPECSCEDEIARLKATILDMENATACVPEDLSVEEYVARLKAELAAAKQEIENVEAEYQQAEESFHAAVDKLAAAQATIAEVDHVVARHSTFGFDGSRIGLVPAQEIVAILARHEGSRDEMSE